MKVDVHKGSVLSMPAHSEGVSCVKVFNDSNALVAIVIEHGGAIVTVTADDADFVSFCAQYGIKTEKAGCITV